MIRLLTAITLVGAAPALAQEEKALTEDVNSILDDLDRRLTDQENQVLTFDEQRLLEADEGPSEKKTKLTFNAKEIKASDAVAADLSNLSNSLLQLDEQIADLDARVQSTKLSILEHANQHTTVSIAGSLPDAETMSLRSLSVMLDGYLIYKLDENDGLWLPSKHIPFFNGPLPSGDHKLELEGRLAHRSSEPLALNSGAATTLKFSRTITVVASSNKRQQISIELKPGKS